MLKDKWLTTTQCVEIHQISRTTLYRLIKSGQLVAGKHYRVVNQNSQRPTYHFNHEAMYFYFRSHPTKSKIIDGANQVIANHKKKQN